MSAEADAAKTGEKEAELFTTAPDADDERGKWTPEELEAEETARSQMKGDSYVRPDVNGSRQRWRCRSSW